MHPVRRWLPLALVLATVAVPAHAAAPKVCKLLTDPRGDTGLQGYSVDGVAQDAPLDILSADIASNGKRIAVVWRVASLDQRPATSPQGVWYDLFFTVGGQRFDAYLVRTAQGDTYGIAPLLDYGAEWAQNTFLPPANATGTVDTVRDEIRLSAPLSLLGTHASPGALVTNIDAYTERWTGGASTTADEAAAVRSYRLGTRSCVTV